DGRGCAVLKRMNVEQCEFLAGETHIKVKSRFTEGVVNLIAGDIGPFEAGMPCTVPLWLAIDLRRRHKCEIIPPEWMTAERLKELIVTEGEMPGLAPLPEAFFEIAHLLTRHAKEDLVEGDQMKTLVQDIWDKREAKLRTSMLAFLSQSDNGHARIDSVQRIELATMRDPILKSLESVDRLVANELSL
ncbi:hypothetical protein PENTCL1PPCAC_9667, partial [Pristionchus entomophagus]